MTTTTTNNSNIPANNNNSTWLTLLLSRLELVHGERYMITVHPSIALECMLAFLSKGYSLHVEAIHGNVLIRVKNRDKHTFEISREASSLIEQHTGIDPAERLKGRGRERGTARRKKKE